MEKKSHWDVPLKSAWTFWDPVTQELIEVRVTRKFKTEDGKYVHLDTLEGKRWGNAPFTALQERIRS